MKFVKLIAKNVRRNLVRTLLTALGTMVLVFVITLIWSVLYFLDEQTREKADNFKAIVTEKWQVPSRMPFAYAAELAEGAAREPGDVRPIDSMSWQFYGGSLDADKRTRENAVFAFSMEPKKLLTMMEELDSLQEPAKSEFAALVQKLEDNRQGIIVGVKRLKEINKQVGERIKLYGLNFKDLDLELEILGTFPPQIKRYETAATINRDYLNNALDDYGRKNSKPHPGADRSLNLMWLRVKDNDAFTKVATQITTSPSFTNPAVKMETASSGISNFMEAYRDLIWMMRWPLSLAILFTLALVLANSISISVRERRTEMAVLKVLGFAPRAILILVLGEALLVGLLAGSVSALVTYGVVNYYMEGISSPIAFFPAFLVPLAALWWGPAIGGSTALMGSILPAWNASQVRVSDVFAKIT